MRTILRLSLVCILTPALLSIAGCPDKRKNPCVAKGQICCVIQTGPNVYQKVEMCVANEKACLAENNPNGGYPKASENLTVNVCLDN